MTFLQYVREKQRERLLSEWDAERNGGAPKEDLAADADARVHWKCSQGHAWTASVKSRTFGGKNCPFCRQQPPIPGETDLAATAPRLLEIWDTERNLPLTPHDLMAGSHKKVWWKCERGHSWSAAPNTMTSAQRGCPYCAGMRVDPGFNDLATLRPDIARLWDAEKNAPLTPADVTAGSGKKVWWRCAAGHSYRAYVWQQCEAGESGGAGCPVCAGRKVLPGFNDLATLKSEVAKEWHPTMNDRGADEVGPGSHYKAWWKCKEGHVWRAAVYARTRANASGCPICGKGEVRRRTRPSPVGKAAAQAGG